MTGGWEEDEEVTAVHRVLRHQGLLEPVTLGGDEELRWLDCDLASLAEHRLGEVTDPVGLVASRREHWLSHATERPPSGPSARSDLETCYWLLDGRERVGGVALANSRFGSHAVRVSSLYVRPPCRGRGLGTRLLRRLREELGVYDLGLALSTRWTWQPVVHLYLRLGMWARSWKRDLELWWDTGRPDPILDVEDQRATLSVVHDGQRAVLAEARREGERLVLPDPAPEVATELEYLWLCAHTTLHLGLALQGWPLVRSRRHWEHSRHSDAVHPEGLAHRIQVWEAWDLSRGWRVDTPRLPGLEYPSWAELEARWRAEEEEEASLGPGEEAPRA